MIWTLDWRNKAAYFSTVFGRFGESLLVAGSEQAHRIDIGSGKVSAARYIRSKVFASEIFDSAGMNIISQAVPAFLGSSLSLIDESTLSPIGNLYTNVAAREMAGLFAASPRDDRVMIGSPTGVLI